MRTNLLGILTMRVEAARPAPRSRSSALVQPVPGRPDTLRLSHISDVLSGRGSCSKPLAMLADQFVTGTYSIPAEKLSRLLVADTLSQ
ncbi:MAG: hypothetical protein LC130_30040 [Bryobacterales bacterium]|nr:hypothetical protein [Bryobacterales bacterium]MEB2361086.1 hypothetical protein [Bryobacterales bacterium]